MTTQATLPADATSSRRAWLSEVTSVVRDEVLTGWSPDSCIASTRVLLETLKAFGVEGRATPTRVAVFNPTAWKLAREQVPVTAWSDGAWSVGVEGDGRLLTDDGTVTWWPSSQGSFLDGCSSTRVVTSSPGLSGALPPPR